jgi:hypothetical protein
MPRKTDPSKVMEVIEEAGNAINVSEVASELLSAFGGSKTFAASFKQEYDDAKPGSVSRSKMLEAVLRSLQAAAPKDKPQDLGTVSEQELRQMLLQTLRSAGLVVTDAPQEEKPAAPAA